MEVATRSRAATEDFVFVDQNSPAFEMSCGCFEFSGHSAFHIWTVADKATMMRVFARHRNGPHFGASRRLHFGRRASRLRRVTNAIHGPAGVSERCQRINIHIRDSSDSLQKR